MSLLRKQCGVALVVALLFLLVVTMISITAARNSSLGLRMAGNMQDAYESFQAAEAGVYAVLGLHQQGGISPFREVDVANPFSGISAADHPLRNLPDGPASVEAAVFEECIDCQCLRASREQDANSSGEGHGIGCDFYRIEAQHHVANKARSRVVLGITVPRVR